MLDKPQLQVDLADLADIRAKLPDAEKILQEKREFAQGAQRDAEHWESLVAKLKSFSLVKIDGTDSPTSRPSPAQDLVVHVIEREGRLMRPAEVTKILESEGHDVVS